jgi:hypothetical protein
MLYTLYRKVRRFLLILTVRILLRCAIQTLTLCCASLACILFATVTVAPEEAGTWQLHCEKALLLLKGLRFNLSSEMIAIEEVLTLCATGTAKESASRDSGMSDQTSSTDVS